MKKNEATDENKAGTTNGGRRKDDSKDTAKEKDEGTEKGRKRPRQGTRTTTNKGNGKDKQRGLDRSAWGAGGGGGWGLDADSPPPCAVTRGCVKWCGPRSGRLRRQQHAQPKRDDHELE